MSKNADTEKSENPLMQELNEMYAELQTTLKGAKILGYSLAPALEPLRRIMLFVGKLVLKLEETEKRVEWLERELNFKDQEKAANKDG